MKILYMANIRFPTKRAHGVQIAKTCEAFGNLGHHVTLLVPKRKNPIQSDPFEYYDIEKNFEIRTTWCWDLAQYGKLGYRIQYATFSIAVAFSSFVKTVDCIYGRDELTLSAVSLISRKPLIWEIHWGLWNRAARFLLPRTTRLVAISRGVKDFYVARGIPASKITVAPDGVDLEQFKNNESKEAARKRLGLPLDKKIIMYIGRIDGYKGADVFCAASTLLPEDICSVIIGGEDEQIIQMHQQYPQVMFLGYHPYRELADNQSAADVLVIPNSTKSEESIRFTSPLKLFTYMASGKPIVASDLPSIREVLSEKSAVFFKPDDPRSLADVITSVLANPAHGSNLSKIANDDVRNYTWESRARTIMEPFS